MIMKAWLRVLSIKLTSKKFKKNIVFGENWKYGGTDLSITVDGTKYLSPMKDECIVTISNLTYKQLIELINGEYYDIEIITGYRNSNQFTIFKGGVLYISNDLGDRKTNEVKIICTNLLVAKYGQSKMNISLNSGINMYGAIKFILKHAGINKSYIDEKFKKQTLATSEAQSQSITSWLDSFSKNNSFVVNGDSSLGTDVSLWNPYLTNRRLIRLKDNNIILTGGRPRLTSQGLQLTVMPTINLCPGDTIILDNSIINIGTEDKDEALKNVGRFLDGEGKYVILELNFNLSNRDDEFSFSIKGRAKSLYNSIGGIYGG